MIKTLVQDTLSTREAAPTALSITKIYFEDGNLARPRYPSLIDYDILKQSFPQGLQIEPAFQIHSKSSGLVEMIFEIADENVDFATNGGDGVSCESILHPKLPLTNVLTANKLNNDKKRCELTWDQGKAKDRDPHRSTVLRLHCKKKSGTLTNEEHVEGGIYIAILNRPRDQKSIKEGRKDDSTAVANTIKIVGFDSSGRSFYQLHKPMFDAGPKFKSVPENVELEVAFRMREGVTFQPTFVLDLSSVHSHFAFHPDHHHKGSVAVLGHNPEGRPCQIRSARFGPKENPNSKTCQIKWVQEIGRATCTKDLDGGESFCLYGHVSSFALMGVDDSENLIQRRLQTPNTLEEEWLEMASHLLAPEADFDPTVIQPPVCTVINGEPVCIQ